MKLSQLPDGYPIVVDTETSALHPDSGARIAAVSCSYRVPDENWQSTPNGKLVEWAVPFDQGIVNLPLGEKEVSDKTIKRLSKWPDWALDEDAGNLSPEKYMQMIEQFKRMDLSWHNRRFDMTMFTAGLRGLPETGWDFQANSSWCTMLAQRVIHPREAVGLKPTAVRLHLGREIGVREGMEDEEAETLKPWLGPKQGKYQDPRYDLVPWSIMKPYAGMDSTLTLLLKEWQWAQLDEDGRWMMRYVDIDHDLGIVLYRMERRGLGFDVNTAFKMETLLEKERQRVAATLPFDPTPNKARKYFFGSEDEGGLGHFPFTDKLTDKKKDQQVDDEVIARLCKENWIGQETAKIYAAHEGLKSAIGKWYGAWPYLCGVDDRLRTEYSQVDVTGGRLSVKRAQTQAIPHDYQLPKLEGLVGVRDLFIEDKECPCGCGVMEMWEFDVSQAEIRIATAMAECRPMLEGFRSGMDSHTIATLLMFGNVFKDEGYAGIEDTHPMWDEYRQIGKRCNLGILYGAGAKVIQEQIKKFTGLVYKIPQISGWIEDWKRAFPEMVTRLEDMERMAIRRGHVKLINGRQAWFSPRDQLFKAFNREIQGSLAESMKIVMIRVENKHPDSLLHQIHDSVILRIAKHELEEVKASVTEIMRDEFETTFTRRWKDTGKFVTVPFLSDAKQFGKKVAA